MDKSFNDDELSDIMKEIEALEEDFSAPTEKDSSPEIEARTSSTVNVVSLDSKRSAPKTDASTSMSFKVQGNLTLELSFDIGGKVVSLEVTESGLSIEMDGGVKFTVPVQETTSLKKAV